MIVKQEETVRPRSTSNRPKQAKSPSSTAGSGSRRWPKRLLWAFLALSLLVGVGYAAATWGGDLGQSDLQLIYHTVNRGDLPIIVTERGNLESQTNVQILCDVDDVSGDGINGTPILWVIENGSSVKKGDLLVEFDSSPHVEQLDRQIQDTERARNAQIQAQVKYDNQITQNETTEADAELDVKLADLEIRMFTDPDNGTHILEVAAIERLIEDVNNEIKAAEANLLLKKNDKSGIESLFKLGYAGKSELDRSHLDYLQAEGQYAAKVNKLRTQLSSLTKKKSYEYEMEMLRLVGAQETDKRKLIQVRRNNEAQLAQSEASLHSVKELLKKEEERLERYRESVEKCKIYAPEDGMVAYAVSQSRYAQVEIREGTPIRPHQHILSLPNLQIMQVKTSVHESVLDQIKNGLSASIRVDAFPDVVYRGSVKSVAVLPDQGGYLSSGTKVYQTIVTIDEEVDQIKPGMSAVVEIHVDHLKDVLCVPIQAIMQVKRDTWCYVDNDGTVERREVKLGRTDDKMIEILEGIQDGERVVLNPMAIMQDSERQDDSDTSESDDASQIDDTPEPSRPATRSPSDTRAKPTKPLGSPAKEPAA